METSPVPEPAQHRAVELVLEDVKWTYDAAMKRAEGADTLAVGLLTASIAAGALVVAAVKDLALPTAAQFLVGVAGIAFVATAVFAATTRIYLLAVRSRLFMETEALGHGPTHDELFGEETSGDTDYLPEALPASGAETEELLKESYYRWQSRANFATHVARWKARAITLATASLLLAALAFGSAMLVKVLS